MSAEQHDFKCAHDQMWPCGVRDHAGDAVVVEPLDGCRRRLVDHHRNGRRRARAAERLQFTVAADIRPVDRDQVEALGAQQPTRLETVGRIVDGGVTVDLS